MYTLDHFVFDVKKQSKILSYKVRIVYWTIVVKTCQFLQLFFPSYRREKRERRKANVHTKS